MIKVVFSTLSCASELDENFLCWNHIDWSIWKNINISPKQIFRTWKGYQNCECFSPVIKTLKICFMVKQYYYMHNTLFSIYILRYVWQRISTLFQNMVLKYFTGIWVPHRCNVFYFNIKHCMWEITWQNHQQWPH